MGSYGQDEDLDEYEDDFIDDQDGDVGVGVGVGRSKYYDEEGEEEDDDEDEEEVEEEKVSEDTMKLLKYRQQIKEELRYKMRKENGGSQSKSADQGRKPPMNNFGSFFGPSQPVIADRVFQESKALMETRHLAPKASTSQNNVKKVNMPSGSGVKNGVKNGVSRQPPPSQFKSKAQTMKDTRDYSFLLSDDVDVPKPHRDPGPSKNLASKPGFLVSSRPAQVPAQSNRPSGHSGGKVMGGFERRKPQESSQVSSSRAPPGQKLTSDNRPSSSSDSRRLPDLKRQPQFSKNHSSNGGNGSIRPPPARALPPTKPSSSTDRKMSSSSTDRRMPASSTDRRMPSSSTDRRMPPTSTDRRMPSSSANRRMPSSSTDRRIPPSSTDRRMPSSSTDRRIPSSSTDRRIPSSSTDRRMPSSSADKRMPSSSADRKMPPPSNYRKLPMEKKATASSVGDRRPVPKQFLPNGQRMSVDKSRAPGLARPQDRSMSVQHSRDNRAFKENMAASRIQMKPPKQSSLRVNLDRDHTRVQKSHEQARMHSQSSDIRKDPNSRKRKAEEDDDDGYDFRSAIRQMFRYDASKYADCDDDDDDMCMEAGFDAIQQEEKRSSRIARQEDDEELEKILEEEKQERLRKKAKMRKMSQR